MDGLQVSLGIDGFGDIVQVAFEPKLELDGLGVAASAFEISFPLFRLPYIDITAPSTPSVCTNNNIVELPFDFRVSTDRASLTTSAIDFVADPSILVSDQIWFANFDGKYLPLVDNSAWIIDEQSSGSVILRLPKNGFPVGHVLAPNATVFLRGSMVDLPLLRGGLFAGAEIEELYPQISTLEVQCCDDVDCESEWGFGSLCLEYMCVAAPSSQPTSIPTVSPTQSPTESAVPSSSPTTATMNQLCPQNGIGVTLSIGHIPANPDASLESAIQTLSDCLGPRSSDTSPLVTVFDSLVEVVYDFGGKEFLVREFHFWNSADANLSVGMFFMTFTAMDGSETFFNTDSVAIGSNSEGESGSGVSVVANTTDLVGLRATKVAVLFDGAPRPPGSPLQFQKLVFEGDDLAGLTENQICPENVDGLTLSIGARSGDDGILQPPPEVALAQTSYCLAPIVPDSSLAVNYDKSPLEIVYDFGGREFDIVKVHLWNSPDVGGYSPISRIFMECIDKAGRKSGGNFQAAPGEVVGQQDMNLLIDAQTMEVPVWMGCRGATTINMVLESSGVLPNVQFQRLVFEGRPV